MNPDDDDLRLPEPLPKQGAAPFPLLTAVVPVLGALVLWQVTGSVFTLWFAALGPLLAVAGVLDAARGRRRQRRRGRREVREAHRQLERAVTQRHDRERATLWQRHPGLAQFARDPSRVWRPGEQTLTLGRGEAPSTVRVSGRADDRPAREIRARAGTLSDAPVTVPLTAGVAVTGPEVLVAGVVRALLLQVCLAHPPGRVRVRGEVPEALPHAMAAGATTVFVGAGGTPVPADADAALIAVPAGTPPPPECAAVLALRSPQEAHLEHGGVSRAVRVEAISAAQADHLARELAERAEGTHGLGGEHTVGLGELLTAAPAAGMRAVVGTSGGHAMELDLVADGPHAVVIGVTGSGKSELLISWVTALSHGRTPAEVAFLLVDFKGGRSFDALQALPHVSGVLTDLDEAQAMRAVQSLRAEIRHRERVLAAHNARDIDEAAGALPRLVIVVDEFAALAAAYPEVHEVFADIAARGRALGMHLILASQRASGTFRDAVLANAPLRIALRVTDAADSRAVLGTEEAAALPGREQDRGLALVRRSADSAPVRVRVARCAPQTLAEVAGAGGTTRARAAWLPALSTDIPLAEVAQPGRVVLGRADLPEQQSQPLLEVPAGSAGFAVVGAAGSGKSTVLATVAAQVGRALWMPADPEEAWDALARCEENETPVTVLIDDADALLARFPPEYGAVWAERLERLAREAGARHLCLGISAARLGGALARIAELLPHRAVLRLGSRAEHVGAGGESAEYTPLAPPGRGRWDRTLVQFAAVPPHARPAAIPPPLWTAGRRPAGFVTAGGAPARALLQRCTQAGVRVVPVSDPDARADLRRGEVLWGSAEQWLARWEVLSAVRAEGDLLVDTACAAEYRALTGHRALPPFAVAGRAWLHTTDGPVRRVR